MSGVPTAGSAPKPQALAILGATGSIGRSTLDVVSRHSGSYAIHALTAHTSGDALIELCIRHRPAIAVLAGRTEDGGLRRSLREAGCTTELLFGPDALVRAVEGSDVVMAAIVGAAGLPSTLAAVRAGKRVLLANKEALVMAGPLFMREARNGGAVLLPIDSEHNAVFQCLPAGPDGRALMARVRRVILTASGGPFRTASIERLRTVTPDEACAHPNWVMGRKISVDSATMMNKGLEVIEARWLFDLDPSQIEVVIHPQSVIHSMVEYVDGSTLAQLSNPDMRVPIAHALAFPDRVESGATPLNLAAVGQLTFEPPDLDRFPCLTLAYAALASGGTAPAILNAANEIAVEAFLGGKLGFCDIARVDEEVLQAVAAGAADSLHAVLEADRLARAHARQLVENSLERVA